jgi:hypothetical protein
MVPWPVTTITSVSADAAFARDEDLEATDVVHHQVGDDDVEHSCSIFRAPSVPLPTTMH